MMLRKATVIGWLCSQPLCRRQSIRRVREPSSVLGIRPPIPTGTLDALQHSKESGIFLEPTLQKAPLPKQRLVCRLDRPCPWPHRSQADAARQGAGSAAELQQESLIDVATRRRGAPVSGSMPASHGARPRRSRVSRATRSFGIAGSASAALRARSTCSKSMAATCADSR